MECEHNGECIRPKVHGLAVKIGELVTTGDHDVLDSLEALELVQTALVRALVRVRSDAAPTN